MEITIPILVDHITDSEPIGLITVKAEGLHVAMAKGFELSEEALYDSFGNVGVKVTAMIAAGQDSQTFLIKEFYISEFSVAHRFFAHKLGKV